MIMLEKEAGSGLCYCNQSCLAFAFSGPLEEAVSHNILKSALQLVVYGKQYRAAAVHFC